MTENTKQVLASGLIDAIEQFNRLQKSLGLTHLSMHICPDSAWIAEEHDVNKTTSFDEEGEIYYEREEGIFRKPPSCHTIIVKI